MIDMIDELFPIKLSSPERITYINQLQNNNINNNTNNKIILDVETNGIFTYNKYKDKHKHNKHKQQPISNKIVQLSYMILDINNNIIDTINLYLNDGDNSIDYYKKIDVDFIKKYGIYPQYVLYKLSDDLSKCSHIIGHNIDFDIKCIITHFNKYKIKYTIPENRYCTMKESKDLVRCINKLGYIKYPKLSELCNYLKIEIDNNNCHDSLYDIKLTYECYLKLYQLDLEKTKYNLETPEDIKKLDTLQKEIKDLENLIQEKQQEYINICNKIF